MPQQTHSSGDCGHTIKNGAKYVDSITNGWIELLSQFCTRKALFACVGFIGGRSRDRVGRSQRRHCKTQITVWAPNVMETLPLFDDLLLDAPPTESIKYVGSKLKLIPQILDLAKRDEAHTVLDGFSGTTRLSQALAQSGYRVICNDVAVWSQVFGMCYLLNHKQSKEYEKLITHLNSISSTDGWFIEHYGGYPNGGCAIKNDGLKKPWQIHNTRKLDAIRQEIDNLDLSDVDKAVALTMPNFGP